MARCESGYEASAQSKGNDGIFQINWRSHKDKIHAAGYERSDMLEVDPNLFIALEISNGGRNWGPWSCQ